MFERGELMSVMLAVGLWIIAMAWLVQLAYMWKGNREIQPAFILLYLVGVALLVIDEYQTTAGVSYYQIITFGASLLAFARLMTLKKKDEKKKMKH